MNKKEENKNIALIRIAGKINLKPEVRDTLDLLGLDNKFTCVVLEGTPSMVGMVKKVKDCVTFGEIDEETFKLLKEKRGEKTKDKEGKEIYKKYFRLCPPRGGFERKGTKVAYKAGGVLGDRKEKINELIKRML